MPPPVLRVDLLGRPIFSLDGRLVAVDTRKALALLALLAVALAEHRGPIGRDSLAAMLWPEADEARARGGLRRALSVLGAATGDVLETTRATVTLRAAAVRSDVVTFRRLAASTEPDDLAAAVALVRGDFLAGFAVRDCAPFDDWTAQMAAALHRDLDGVLERLVGARVRSGELSAALTGALRWLDLDPLHEPAHRAVLRLFAWTGRRREAVEQYQRCVRVLGDALGVAPVSATTRLYDAIRTDTLAPPPRRQPPQPDRAIPAVDPATRATSTPANLATLPMVGRDDALRALLDAAANPGGRAVLVTGEAGAGRSRLVTEFAGRAGRVLVARAHGGEAALSFAPIADLLRAAAGRSPGLDPEVALELSRIVPELLPAGRTAATPLDSPGARDRFFDAIVRGLAGAGARAVVVEDVHAASTASAQVLAYLLHRLDRVGCPLVLTWRDPGLPSRHPVRVAVAGGRLDGRITTVALPRLTPAEVAELVAGTALDASAVWGDTAGLPILVVEAIRSGGEGLPGSVRELLAARLAEVSEETAQVLAALAVLGGVADPAVLRATSGRGDVETVEAVEEAVEVGLLREEGAAVAFTHDALRRVAYDDLSRVRRRLLHTRAAEAVVAGGTAAGHPGSVARPGVVAHHWHEAGRDDLAAPWARTAAQSAARLFAHEETLLHLDSVVAFGREDAETALGAGDALVALGRYDEALASFGRAGSLAQGADPVVRARIERRAADVHARRGEWALADIGLAAAAAMLVDLPVAGSEATQRLRAQVLADRAVVASRAGHPEAAAVHVAAAQAVTPESSVATVENAAGLVALGAGDTAAAVRAFEAALAAAPDVVDRAAVLNNLARALAATDDPARAVTTAQEALALGMVHGDRHRLAALHANLADRLHEAGAQDEARSQQLAAAALFAEVGADPLDRPDIWLLTSW